MGLAGFRPFSPFHLIADQVDAAILAHGAPAKLRTARPCGCWREDTSTADPACTQCYPLGYTWDAAQDTTVLGPNRRPTRQQEAAGTFEQGDANFTFLTGLQPSLFSRLTLPLSVVVIDDTLTKGKHDILRYPEVVAIDRARYATRTDGADPRTVDIANVDLVLTGPNADVQITGRQVVWLNPAIPDGTLYQVQARVRAEYVVIEPRDRNEGGTTLPYQYHCRRLDCFKHPNAPDGLTF